MSPVVQVRRAVIAELDEAARLFDGYLAFYEKQIEPSASRAFIAGRLDKLDSVIFLAWIGDRAVGFMQLYPTFASLSLAPAWVLNDLYVEVSARGRGVGEALMAKASALAAETGAAEVFLQTALDNYGAQRLYEKLGYQRDEQFVVYTLDTSPTSRR